MIYISVDVSTTGKIVLRKNRYKFKKKKVQYIEKKPFLADKEIIFRSSGRAKVFNISHRLQIFALFIICAIFCGYGFNYYFYHLKDKELGKTRDAYVDLMADISALQNNLKEVVDSVEDAGDGLKEINEYREKALQVEDKIKKITVSESWLNQDNMAEKVSAKEAMLQKDVAIQENNELRNKIVSLGVKLEKLQQNVRGLENAEVAILDKIEKLSGQEIDEIKNNLAKINQTLKVQKQYFNPLSNIQDGKGGKYIPLKDTKISPRLQNKMSEVFKKIDLLDDYKIAMNTVPLGSPVYKYRLSSTFGQRSDPFKSILSRHKGLDMSAALGSRVSAPADGKVISAGFQNNGYGNIIEIKHNNGFVTKYAHLNKIYVKKGDYIKYNQAIGEVGRTGRATGSHLHYEVLYNGRNVNPLTFVNISSMTKL